MKPSNTRNIIGFAIGTLLILSIPLIAMQFTEEVQWGPFDFVLIGTLLFGSGLLYEFVTKNMTAKKNRIAVGFLFILAVMYIWAELAVGIFTNLGS